MEEIIRKFLNLLIILAVLWGIKSAFHYWDSFKDAHPIYGDKSASQPNPNSPQSLPGLPANLEPYLQAAQSQGTRTFKKWLDYYGPQIEDPRKAWIELDYVLMVSRDDMAEARRIFAEVKARTPSNSPVYPRIKKLASGYE